MRGQTRRIQTLIRQGRLARLDDSQHTQVAQVELFEGEIVNHVERLQNYGFTSNPTSGGAYIINVGGKGNQPVIVVINDDKSRIKLENGDDVAVYHAEGHKILLTQGGEIRATCTKLIATCAESATIDTPKTTITGDADIEGTLDVKGAASFGAGAKVEGDISATGDIQAGDISLKKHPHIDSNNRQTSEAKPS